MTAPELTSRYEDSVEVDEMESFVLRLNSLDPAASAAVKSLFYDSKAGHCDISLHGTPSDTVVARIMQAAHFTLSQYVLLGDYRQGLPFQRAAETLAAAEEAELWRRREESAEADLLAENGEYYSEAIHAEIEMRAQDSVGRTTAALPQPKGFRNRNMGSSTIKPQIEVDLPNAALPRKGVENMQTSPTTTSLERGKPSETVQKGKRGEAALNDWFQKQEIGYIAVCQAVNTFAPIFKGGIKRPDFIMLIEGVGLLAIDAKNKSSSGGGFTLELETELKKAIAFERLFRMPLWYAFCDCDAGMKQWHWISALKAVEVGIKRSSEKGEDFLSIKLEHMEAISVAADMAKLYTHRSPSYKKLADS